MDHFKKLAITVYKDGTWELWGAMDAFYARADDNWLAEIGGPEIVAAYHREAEVASHEGSD